MARRCIKCKNRLSNEDVFCGQCGTPTTEVNAGNRCINCGKPIAKGVDFCSSCGFSQSAGTNTTTKAGTLCENCGKPIIQGSAFCSSCGVATIPNGTVVTTVKPVRPVSSASQSVENLLSTVATNPKPVSNQTSRNKSWYTVLFLGISIMLVIGGILTISHHGSETSTNPPTPIPDPISSSSYSGIVGDGNSNGVTSPGATGIIISFTSIIQNQNIRAIGGNLDVLGVGLSISSGTFTGSITDRNIQFTVTPDGSNYTENFTGRINTDGSMSGSYTVSNGDSGSWFVTPSNHS